MYKEMLTRRILLILVDIFFISVSFYLAFFIRFEGRIPEMERRLFLQLLPIVISVRFLCYLLLNLYKGMWRYASITDLFNITRAVLLSSVLFAVIIYFSRGFIGFPRSVFVIDTLIILIFTGGVRILVRVYREITVSKDTGVGKNVLIVGAGDAGNTIIKEIKNNPKLNYNVIGFIDDDKTKKGLSIQGTDVLGTRKDIKSIVSFKRIDEIILALPSATRQQMRNIVNECEKANVIIKTSPAMGDIINGKVLVNQIREVSIEDLLGRDVVEIDDSGISAYIKGKRVLITGAGGSIGSEICRQVAKYNPSFMAFFGRGENSIYQIHDEFKRTYPLIEHRQVLGDVINKKKLLNVFSELKPHIIFHAGADKHVPLMEYNPDEAVLNNAIGTKNVIDAAEATGVEKVVCISTDKAADPASIMGCTKRIAETYVQSRNNPVTASVAVRFGNVLGSRGSVIELFKRQIASGGPVTVTHPDMTRYFMTIPEAARLVLQAGAIGKCGEIFLLDMGSPVKITDLAKDMIRLSGFEPEVDIPIKFVGLRPGEKLVEALISKNETVYRTSHQKILMIKSEQKHIINDKDFEELQELAIAMDKEGIIKKLKQLVPNYKQEGS